jgi:cephalosporin-C deacetylase-like acetyl esterase
MFVLLILLLAALCRPLAAAPPARWAEMGDGPGSAMLADYFRAETAKLADRCLADVETLEQWQAQREQLRRELLEMLGLDPMPERTPLEATVTGTLDHEQFTVEKLHFQSRPKLYVTANLYVPKGLEGRAPAVLYVCGHGRVAIDGVSFGNKAHYQHHPTWFAKNGYVCLVIDTIQLGEIEGIHHGTYRYDMWWWNNRGYTSAGTEAWNCVRAVDYLQSRPEVDPERIGVTGRSGGGAYSWWISAIDERIQAAVPVAGITDLTNHVVTGCVEGHCDCMYKVNTYRWDYATVAALVAPRALMIGNTDDDRIFPQDGVERLYEATRRIYALYGKPENLALTMTAGGHADTPELREAAFQWMNQHLKGKTAPIEDDGQKPFTPQEVKVFDTLPDDSINADVHETFVPMAPKPALPASADAWVGMRDAWRTALVEKCFAGWPGELPAVEVREIASAERGGARLTAYEFESQPHVRLRFYLLRPAGRQHAGAVVLKVADEQAWREVLAGLRGDFAEVLEGEPLPEAAGDAKPLEIGPDAPATVFFAPRGIGASAWGGDKVKQTQIRRRFMLLGQTLDGMRVWDVRRAIQAVRALDACKDAQLSAQGERQAGVLAVYASLFEPALAGLRLDDPPANHRDGPIFLNVSRFLHLPQTVAMAAERTPVAIAAQALEAWVYPLAVGEKLGWDADRVTIAQ